ncbi:MAG: Flp1 family type IVb pilin [Oscillospiraceae bacterium]|nr:Flp1 family type IVb pilin [Oscillospiraceae bacterium]
MKFMNDRRGEINIVSMVLIIIVVIALVAIFQEEMTDIVTTMFDKIRSSMGI